LARRLANRAAEAVRPALDAGRDALDPDTLLQSAMTGLIALARHDWPTQRGLRWRTGEPLRLLFAGYAGTRNTGADVRVEEMIRQFRHVLGAENVELSILTFDPSLTRGYFRATHQIEAPVVFPKFLYDTIRDQHGVIACEGSMFKSKFSSALTTFMVGAYGLAVAGDKLAVAYGGEAGAMTPSLERFVEANCQQGLILCRNEASRTVLARLGVKSRGGTDTAWTYDPGATPEAEAVLRAAGWDGTSPIAAFAPINPYWWPVRPDLGKAVARAALGLHDGAHYRSIYFHHEGDEVDERQAVYLDKMASAARRWRAESGAFIVAIGMEQLDRAACEGFAERVGDVPVICSDAHELQTMVGVLHRCQWLVASRYHALVTSMMAGVAPVGVTMDERIRNLMDDRGSPERCLGVDDEDLSERVVGELQAATRDLPGERLRSERTVVRNLREMGRMGQRLAEYVVDQLPDFPLPPGRGTAGDPWDHLPPMSARLAAMVERHRAEGVA
jgi:polysaccharide pyruvyl transferase WcaK-like protein